MACNECRCRNPQCAQCEKCRGCACCCVCAQNVNERRTAEAKAAARGEPPRVDHGEEQ